MEKYYNLLFPIIQNGRKDLNRKIFKALYEMGKEGDYDRVGNKEVDAILEELYNEEDMTDFIGELYYLLTEESTKHR